MNNLQRQDQNDPRVYFAAERTLLAWIRTGLAIMGFGFVVARFGIFLQISAVQRAGDLVDQTLSTRFSSLVGITLVLVGALSIFVASWQHRAFVASIPAADIPKVPLRHISWLLAFCLGLLGLALAAYLAM